MMEVDGKPWTDKPWLPYQATAFLEQLGSCTVFEWGSGGSTCFFIRHGVQLTTVEHDMTWFDGVRNVLERQEPWDWTSGTPGLAKHRHGNQNWDFFLIPPEPGNIGPDKANPDHYKSGSTELGPCNFREYASAIDGLGLFDLVLVDGMARASCLKHAVPHVKPGGVLMLDNTDDNRSYYLQNTLTYFTDWERIDFFGYGPILDYPWRCTAFVNNRKASYGE